MSKSISLPQALFSGKSNMLSSDKHDLILATRHEVEKLNKEQVCENAKKSVEASSFMNFYLGCLLWKLRTNAWHEKDGYASFSDYVRTELEISPSKANYLRRNYEALAKSGLSWKEVEHLGWTKLSRIARLLNNKNAKEWIAIAETCTVLELEKRIKVLKKLRKWLVNFVSPLN